MTKARDDGWRAARRNSARDAIVDAAWTLARQEGLLGWSMRDLASEAGITTPTVYAYFDSKNAIYDAMFGRAAMRFDERMAEPLEDDTPREHLVAYAQRFFEFCTSDPVRYQLLFQRVIPAFEPSPSSYAPSVRALDRVRELLASNGITEGRQVDLWTAVATGLVDQQVSNDPGGDRWLLLIDEAVDMLLTHCRPPRVVPRSASRPTRTTGARA